MFEEKEAYSLHSRSVFVGRCYCNYSTSSASSGVGRQTIREVLAFSINDHGDAGGNRIYSKIARIKHSWWVSVTASVIFTALALSSGHH